MHHSEFAARENSEASRRQGQVGRESRSFCPSRAIVSRAQSHAASAIAAASVEQMILCAADPEAQVSRGAGPVAMADLLVGALAGGHTICLHLRVPTVRL